MQNQAIRTPEIAKISKNDTQKSDRDASLELEWFKKAP